MQEGSLDEEAARFFEEVLWTAAQTDSIMENLLPVLIALRVQVGPTEQPMLLRFYTQLNDEILSSADPIDYAQPLMNP